MPMTFDSRPRNFGELLGKYANPVIVPEFQRGYSWEKGQIATFWEDLQDFHARRGDAGGPSTYFLGAIVVMASPEQLVVLDGQQRLATATILFSALRDVARSLQPQSAQAGADFARDVQRDLIESDDTQYAITLGQLDRQFFEQTIQSDPPQTRRTSLRSHTLIKSARDHLTKAITEQMDATDHDAGLIYLRSLLKVLTKHVFMVEISVDSEDDAFLIFETLNDRGLRLSVPDLLVNYLMRTSTSQRAKRAVRAQWNVVIESMGRRDVGRFLRHMWLSKYGDVKARGLFREIKQTIEHKRLSREAFARSCAEECESYVAILDLSTKVLDKIARPHVAGLIRLLGVQSSMPLLLAGQRCLSASDFEKLARMSVGLVVRHSIIANLNPSELESAFYEGAREIRRRHASTKQRRTCLKGAKAILAKINPSDSLVESSAADLYLDKNQAKYILVQLANAMQSRTKELAVDNVSIEHIFPLNPSSAWRNAQRLTSALSQLRSGVILPSCS